MPSFDVVSEVDHHELSNGLNQANREVTTRFDFKGSNSKYELSDLVITMNSESEFQLQQMYEGMMPDLLHNQKHFFTFADQQQQKIDNLF